MAGRIAQFLEGVRHDRPVWEPFCGALWVTSALSGRRYASDACEPLITLYRAIQAGWEPPEHMDEEEYLTLKAKKDNANPLTAFAGFACSNMGVYFCGYAKQRNPDGTWYNFARGGRNSLARKFRTCRDVTFFHADYRVALVPEDVLVYADPPYRGTDPKAYRALSEPFDSDAFWEWARHMRDSGVTIVVSEYGAPSDWRCVLEIQTETQLRSVSGKKIGRVERLFM